VAIERKAGSSPAWDGLAIEHPGFKIKGKNKKYPEITLSDRVISG
jgi:hypothetical protein